MNDYDDHDFEYDYYYDIPDYDFSLEIQDCEPMIDDPPDFDYEPPNYYSEIDEDELERRIYESRILDELEYDPPPVAKKRPVGVRIILGILRVIFFIVCICLPPLFLLYIAVYGSSAIGRSDIDWTNVAGP